jgi:hypothetical protein
VRKRHFLSHLYIKSIILPRQARDEHRENSKKCRFLAGIASVLDASPLLQLLAQPVLWFNVCQEESVSQSE